MDFGIIQNTCWLLFRKVFTFPFDVTNLMPSLRELPIYISISIYSLCHLLFTNLYKIFLSPTHRLVAMVRTYVASINNALQEKVLQKISTTNLLSDGGDKNWCSAQDFRANGSNSIQNHKSQHRNQRKNRKKEISKIVAHFSKADCCIQCQLHKCITVIVKQVLLTPFAICCYI